MDTGSGLEFRPAWTSDLPAVADLIERVFDEFVAPDFQPGGISEFKAFTSAAALTERCQEPARIAFVAVVEGQIRGYIELRGTDHISLLFVDKAWHRRGLARELWRLAMGQARELDPEQAEFTVNASPYAVEMYRKLGFSAYEPLQHKDGFSFVPMKKTAERSGGGHGDNSRK